MAFGPNSVCKKFQSTRAKVAPIKLPTEVTFLQRKPYIKCI